MVRSGAGNLSPLSPESSDGMTSMMPPTLQLQASAGFQGNQMNQATSQGDPVIEQALAWYKAHKIPYQKSMADDMYKVLGKSHQALYQQVVANKKIDENFVRLVIAGQEKLKIKGDGKYGSGTKTAVKTFKTGGDKGIDYARLFADKKLEIGVAIGDEFDNEARAVIALLKQEGFKLSTQTPSKNTYTAKRNYQTPGDNSAGTIEIEVIVDVTWSSKSKPKDTYGDFLGNKEISIYSGHARYGTGPDFDAKDKTAGNFKIGKGYNSHMNDILKNNSNDLKAMSKQGEFDLKSYQVWFFNACSSNQYLDEIRKGHVTDKSGKNNKSRKNLRFMGTKHSIESDPLPILKGVLNMKTMDEIIASMNKYEEDNSGESKPGGYFMAD